MEKINIIFCSILLTCVCLCVVMGAFLIGKNDIYMGLFSMAFGLFQSYILINYVFYAFETQLKENKK